MFISWARKARTISLVLTLALGAAACGSTAQQRSAASRASDELSGRQATSEAGDNQTVVAGGGDAAGGSASAPGGGATTAAGRRVTSAAQQAAATGVKDTTPISLGVLYVDGGNAVISAGFGNTPVSFGDGRLEAQAVADDINAHGGAGGRKLELHFGKVAATNADGPGLQAACESMTADNHVFAIMSMFNVRSLLVDCAAKAKVLLMATALGGGDDTLYSQYRSTLFTPTQLSLDREQRLVLESAHAAGRITNKSKVGVLIQDDDPQYTRVYDKTIDPVLKGWGVAHEAAHIANAASTSDISGAVLRFATDNVDQVVFSVGNGGIPEVFFMQTAEQQQYRPGYNMGDSTDTWFVGSQVPVNQRKKIAGAGTYPVANVQVSEYPTTPREKHCFDVIGAAGEHLSDRHSSLTATFYCELIYGFAAIAARVPGKLSADGWRTAYYGFGSAYPAITSFASNLGNGRNDNPSLYRLVGYRDACQCISYLSDARPLE